MARAKHDDEGLEQPHRTAQWGIALNEFNAEWCARLERELAQEVRPAGR